jgi:hypothetical protein
MEKNWYKKVVEHSSFLFLFFTFFISEKYCWIIKNEFFFWNPKKLTDIKLNVKPFKMRISWLNWVKSNLPYTKYTFFIIFNLRYWLKWIGKLLFPHEQNMYRNNLGWYWHLSLYRKILQFYLFQSEILWWARKTSFK